MTTAGVLTEFSLPFNTYASGIAAGPDGNLWITGYYSSTINRMTTSGAVTQFSITDGQWPGEITAGPDGNLWFTEFGEIGRITTAGVITQFTIPSANAGGPIAAFPDGSLWFGGGFNPGLLGRTTTTGVFSEVLLTMAGRGAPGDIAVGPDGNLWFTDPTAGKIGRLALQAGQCLSDATTLCLNGGRYQVRAEWAVPSQGTSGHGNAVPLTGDTGTFWFFQESSVEVVVKVLDGCSSNGHAWVFAGGLTNVGVTLTVTDTQTVVTRTYTNPASTAFQPIQDTTAFVTCRERTRRRHDHEVHRAHSNGASFFRDDVAVRRSHAFRVGVECESARPGHRGRHGRRPLRRRQQRRQSRRRPSICAPGTYVLSTFAEHGHRNVPRPNHGALRLQPGMALVGSEERVDTNGDGVPDPVSPDTPDAFAVPGTETIIDGTALDLPGEDRVDCAGDSRPGFPDPMIYIGVANSISFLSVVAGGHVVIGEPTSDPEDHRGSLSIEITSTVVDGAFFFANSECAARRAHSVLTLSHSVVRAFGLGISNFYTGDADNNGSAGPEIEATINFNLFYNNGRGLRVAGGDEGTDGGSVRVHMHGNVFRDNGTNLLVQGSVQRGLVVVGNRVALTSDSDTFGEAPGGSVILRGGVGDAQDSSVDAVFIPQPLHPRFAGDSAGSLDPRRPERRRRRQRHPHQGADQPGDGEDVGGDSHAGWTVDPGRDRGRRGPDQCAARGFPARLHPAESGPTRTGCVLLRAVANGPLLQPFDDVEVGEHAHVAIGPGTSVGRDLHRPDPRDAGQILQGELPPWLPLARGQVEPLDLARDFAGSLDEEVPAVRAHPAG